jgi:hypothetical protein
MGRGTSDNPKTNGVTSRFRGLRKIRYPHEFPFTGHCPVRQYTADGEYLGECDIRTRGGFCSQHGEVSRFLPADPFGYNPLKPATETYGVDLAEADERLFPAKDQLDLGPFTPARVQLSR